MRVGKTNVFSGVNDINSLSSNVPIPDNANYTTIFKYSVTGLYYERLSTGEIRRLNCDCVFETTSKVILNQVGLAAPVDTVLEQGFVSPIVWTYNAPGVYTGTLAGAFTQKKTMLFISNPNVLAGFASLNWVDVNTIRLRTTDPAGVLSDGILDDASVIISVHD